MTTKQWLSELEKRVAEITEPLEDLGLDPLTHKLDELVEWLLAERVEP